MRKKEIHICPCCECEIPKNFALCKKCEEGIDREIEEEIKLVNTNERGNLDVKR